MTSSLTNQSVALLVSALAPHLEKSPGYKALTDTVAAIGQCIDKDQQLFVSANLTRLHEFIATDAGKTLTAMFVEEWQKSTNKERPS